jgi:hypothetical protein
MIRKSPSPPYLYTIMPFGPDAGLPIRSCTDENLTHMLSVVVSNGELGRAIKSELKYRKTKAMQR